MYCLFFLDLRRFFSCPFSIKKILKNDFQSTPATTNFFLKLTFDVKNPIGPTGQNRIHKKKTHNCKTQLTISNFHIRHPHLSRSKNFLTSNFIF